MSLPRHPERLRAVMRSVAGFFWGWGLVTMSAFAYVPAADTVIRAQAVVTYYTPTATQVQTQYSNEIEVRVAKVEALELTAPQGEVSGPPGASVILPHVLINTGNTPSTYQFFTSASSGCSALSLPLPLRLVYDLSLIHI